jgi:hypothetical protein
MNLSSVGIFSTNVVLVLEVVVVVPVVVEVVDVILEEVEDFDSSLEIDNGNDDITFSPCSYGCSRDSS